MSTHEPPRIILYFPTLGPEGFSERPNQSPHHSQTLPNRSHKPSDVFPLGNKPTGATCPRAIQFACEASSGGAFPHGYLLLCGPLAARSHSASVGNRPPAQAQYAAASNQLTPVTGRFGNCFCVCQE